MVRQVFVAVGWYLCADLVLLSNVASVAPANTMAVDLTKWLECVLKKLDVRNQSRGPLS